MKIKVAEWGTQKNETQFNLIFFFLFFELIFKNFLTFSKYLFSFATASGHDFSVFKLSTFFFFLNTFYFNINQFRLADKPVWASMNQF